MSELGEYYQEQKRSTGNNQPPPMTLPQEITDKIEKEAEHHANVEWSEKAKHNSLAQSINWDNSKDDYQAGATEWAGKAQELADTLKWIQMHAPIEPVVDDVISAALAKYKEVSNG